MASRSSLSICFNGWLPEDSRSRRWLLSALAAALILRLCAACAVTYVVEQAGREFLITGDAEGYWELARKIVKGEDFAIHTPPRYVLRMPGFPAVLAISVGLFGPRLLLARLMLAIVGTLCCYWVFLLGKQLRDERTGVLAATAAAVMPVFVGFSATILSETTFALSMLFSLSAATSLVQSLRDESWGLRWIGWSLFTGVTMAGAVYVRPSWLLAPVLCSGVFIFTTRHPWRGVLATLGVIVAMVLALLPWGLRNQRVSGHFTLTTFWMGPSLYDGLHPGATGESDMRFFDEDQLSTHLSEYAVDQHYKAAAWQFVRNNPLRTIQLGFAKLIRFWKPWPNAAQFDNIWAKLAVIVFALPVWGFALLGGVALLRPSLRQNLDAEHTFSSPVSVRDIWALAFCAGPILYFSALHTIFVGSIRYRLPAEYPLLVLASIGWQIVFCRSRKSSRQL